MKDINWHINFFKEVFGMTIIKIENHGNYPKQVWLEGGLQLILNPNITQEGRFAHIGITVSNIEAIKSKSNEWKFKELDDKANWIVLPSGLIIELMLPNEMRISNGKNGI